MLFHFTIISIGNTVIQSSPRKHDKLSFSHILVCKKPDLVTSVYRRRTYTSLLKILFSFKPSKYKIGLVKTFWIGVTKSTAHEKLLITI